ncbi:MAG: topology modulation protein, partial [Nitratireductor sp.]
KLGLPVTHLDQLWWNAGWVESHPGEFRDRVAELVRGDKWVIDGTSPATFDIRLPRADTVIWVDQPRLACLARAYWRFLKLRGTVREDMAEGCSEKFDMEFARFIWTYNREIAPLVEEGLRRYGDHVRFFRLRSDGEMNEFVERL